MDVPAPVTLSALTRDYLALYAARHHSAEWLDNATRVLTKEVLPRFGHMQPEQLVRRDIARVIAGIVEEGKLSKANHTLIALRNVYRWGINTGRLDCANPARDIERQPVKARERVLNELELAALWHAAPGVGDFGRILRLLMLTGCRRQEIGSLSWLEVNRAARQLELPAQRVKNRRPFIVPLSELALAQLPPERPGYPNLFGRCHGRAFDGWSTGLKLAREHVLGMPRWTPHDLRRTFVTMCNEKGLADPHVIEAAVNHIGGAKAGVAGVYNRAAYLPQRRALLEAWSVELRRIVGPG